MVLPAPSPTSSESHLTWGKASLRLPSTPLSNTNNPVRHPQGHSRAWNIQNTRARLEDSLSCKVTEQPDPGAVRREKVQALQCSFPIWSLCLEMTDKRASVLSHWSQGL